MKHKKILNLILVLSVVTVVSGCAQRPAQTTQRPKIDNNKQAEISSTSDSQEQEKVSDEPEIITSDIDTSSWKTYRNDEYGLELKYPDNWRIRTNAEIENSEDSNFLMIDNGITVIMVKFDSPDYNLDFNKGNNAIKNIIIGEYTSYAATKNKSMRRYWYSYFFKDDNNKNFEILFRPVNLNYNLETTDIAENDKKVVYQIISTIKFMNIFVH